VATTTVWLTTYPFHVTVYKVFVMQVAQTFADVGQLVNSERVRKCGGVGLTSSRRFALG